MLSFPMEADVYPVSMKNAMDYRPTSETPLKWRNLMGDSGQIMFAGWVALCVNLELRSALYTRAVKTLLKIGKYADSSERLLIAYEERESLCCSCLPVFCVL